jgi:hypothetical protein
MAADAFLDNDNRELAETCWLLAGLFDEQWC